MHHWSRVVYPGEDDDLFQEGRSNRDISDSVDVGIQQHRSAEFISQRIRQEVIKHVIVLYVPCWCVDIGDGVCLCVLNGYLSVVCEKVLCGSIIDWHSDEAMLTKTTSSIANTCKEHGQIVGFPIKLLLERGDRLVVQFGGCRSGIGIIEVQDSM